MRHIRTGVRTLLYAVCLSVRERRRRRWALGSRIQQQALECFGLRFSLALINFRQRLRGLRRGAGRAERIHTVLVRCSKGGSNLEIWRSDILHLHGKHPTGEAIGVTLWKSFRIRLGRTDRGLCFRAALCLRTSRLHCRFEQEIQRGRLLSLARWLGTTFWLRRRGLEIRFTL